MDRHDTVFKGQVDIQAGRAGVAGLVGPVIDHDVQIGFHLDGVPGGVGLRVFGAVGVLQLGGNGAAGGGQPVVHLALGDALQHVVQRLLDGDAVFKLIVATGSELAVGFQRVLVALTASGPGNTAVDLGHGLARSDTVGGAVVTARHRDRQVDVTDHQTGAVQSELLCAVGNSQNAVVAADGQAGAGVSEIDTFLTIGAQTNQSVYFKLSVIAAAVDQLQRDRG